MARLLELLKVRQGEGRMVGLLSALMVAASAGMGMGGSGIDALFFARFGVEYLPTMYILLGIVTLVTMLAISGLLGRVDQRALYVTLPLVLAIILAAERALLLLEVTWLYPVIWLAKGVMASFQSLSMWGLASALCDTRQAKRLFPLFSAGAILGAVIGSSLTPVVVGLLHSENLILIWAALLGVSYAVGRALLGNAPPAPKKSGRGQKQPGLVSEMLHGFQFVRRSRLLSFIAVSAFFFSIAWFSLEFPFNSTATQVYPNEDALAGFLGIFMGINTGVALLISLLLANRLFARFGIMPMLFTFPLIYLVAFIVLPFAAPFGLIAAFRFAQIGWATGIAGTAWQAMYNVVPRQRRDQARAFMGLPEQAGVLSAGVLLNVAQRALAPQQVYLIGLGAVIPILIVLWLAISAYRGALVDALRAGQPQVFYDEEEPFGGFARDAAAVAALIEGIKDSDPVIRRVSVEVLGNLRLPQADPALLAALNDPDSTVRTAALRGLAHIDDRKTLLLAKACLGDDNLDVKLEALDVLRRAGELPGDVRKTLGSLLNDPSPAVRARSGLLLADIDKRARSLLSSMTRDANPDARANALTALGLWAGKPALSLVIAGLSDDTASVRQAAASALAHFKSPRALSALIGALGDASRPVREAAAESLAVYGEAALKPALNALADPALENGALAALDRLPVDAAQDTLKAYARERTTDALHYYRMWADIAPHSANERFSLLADSLINRARQHGIRALTAHGLMGDKAGMALAIQNLRSDSAEQRANALETLEAVVASPEAIRPLLALWEANVLETSNPTDALLRALQERDTWLRACGALASGGSDHWEIKVALETVIENDPDPQVREAASSSLAEVDDTDQNGKLPWIEQVLFLRRVPLFASLEPIELSEVRRIAQEKEFQTGSAICRQGEDGHEAYIITSGEVAVMVTKGKTAPHEVARRTVGDIIGEMSIITAEPRMASLIADGPVKTLAIERDDFTTLLRERPGLTLEVMKVLCNRINERSRSR